jgi:predicted transcriptional regulator
MLRRVTDDRRALLRKLENVEAFPLFALQAVRELRADLDSVEAEALRRARDLGASLEDIAEALEITRQGVAYRLKTLAGNREGDDSPEETDDEIVDITASETEAPDSAHRV